MESTLIAEKVEQARDAVAASEADAWLTFCRETNEIAEPYALTRFATGKLVAEHGAAAVAH